MAFMCKKGHVHGTQQTADKCYICLRRRAKKSSKRAREELNAELAELFDKVVDNMAQPQCKKA